MRCQIFGRTRRHGNMFLAMDMFAWTLAARPDCVFLCLGGNSLDRSKGNTTMTLLVRT